MDKRWGIINTAFCISGEIIYNVRHVSSGLKLLYIKKAGGEGNIYPCDVLMYDEYALGNIYTGMDENKLIKMREKFGKPEECANCWARYICGGKCFAEMQGSIKANHKFMCIMRQYMVESTLYIYDYIQTNKPEYLENYLK